MTEEQPIYKPGTSRPDFIKMLRGNQHVCPGHSSEQGGCVQGVLLLINGATLHLGQSVNGLYREDAATKKSVTMEIARAVCAAFVYGIMVGQNGDVPEPQPDTEFDRDIEELVDAKPPVFLEDAIKVLDGTSKSLDRRRGHV